MKAFKAIGIGLAVIVVGLLAVYGTMRAGLWNTQYAAVRAKWAKPPSYFMRVDGVDVHVDDQGHGPVLIMLHGSILNLHEWDPVVARLKDRYRIVRIDWPPYGVSSPDPKGVSTTKRASDLLAGVVDRLGLKSFVIVATSNGANVALQYVSDHPGPVKAMAFSILPLERPSQTRKVGSAMASLAKFQDAYLPNYHLKLFYRLILKDTASPGFHPPKALVDMMYDMDNLPGAAARQRAFIASNVKLFKSTDYGAVAAKVHVPVLLQWCQLDTVIAQSADASVARFTNAPVQVIYYPTLGHFPMWENPDLFTRDLAAFLDRVEAGKS